MPATLKEKRKVLLEWLRSNEWGEPTRAERDSLASKLSCDESKVRERLKSLRSEFGENKIRGILPEKESIIKDWFLSHDAWTSNEETAKEALQQSTGLSAILVSRVLERENRKIKANQPREGPDSTYRKRNRTAKGSGYRAALETWVEEHEGRLWLNKEELTHLQQELSESCSKEAIDSWFTYRRKRGKRKLGHAIKDPPNFIAQNGANGNEDTLRDFFMAIHSGAIPPPAGQDLVASLTGLPVQSIAELIDEIIDDPNYFDEIDPCTDEERSDGFDSNDEAADVHPSGSLSKPPAGTDLTLGGNTDSTLTTGAEPFHIDISALCNNPGSNRAFPGPSIDFPQLLLDSRSGGLSSTVAGIKFDIGRHIQSCRGLVPRSTHPSGRLTLILSQGMMGFVDPEVFSICPPQASQNSGGISEEFVFPDAPFPPLRQEMESKILDYQNGTIYSCLYCDKSYDSEVRLIDHLPRHTDPFYYCDVEDCPEHVGKVRMPLHQAQSHMWKKHGKTASEWIPTQNHYWIRQPQVIRSHIDSLAKRAPLAANTTKTNTNRSTPSHADAEQSRTSKNNWYSNFAAQARALCQSSPGEEGGISDETKAEILDYNLRKQQEGKHPTPWTSDQRLLVRGQFRGAGKWVVDQSSGFNLLLHRKKLPQGRKFFVIDVEGHLSGKPPTVDQVAMVDIDSFTEGHFNPVFNIKISDTHPVPDPKIRGTFQDNLLEFGKGFYWHYNKERLSGTPVTLLQAAETIKNSGITPQDYIIVWHRNQADVTALRHLLSRAGYDDFLPPKEHIIRLNYLFGHNLELPDEVICSLEHLFSACFPENSLWFTHHDALIDSKKAACMTLLALKLCNGEDTTDLRRIKTA